MQTIVKPIYKARSHAPKLPRTRIRRLIRWYPATATNPYLAVCSYTGSHYIIVSSQKNFYLRVLTQETTG